MELWNSSAMGKALNFYFTVTLTPVLKEDSPAEGGEVASGLIQIQSRFVLGQKGESTPEAHAFPRQPQPLCTDQLALFLCANLRFWILVLNVAVFFFPLIYLGDGGGVQVL